MDSEGWKKKQMFGIKNCIKWLFLIVGTAALFLTCSQAFAEEKTETVRVAVMDYPNYIQMNEDGTVSGYVYEYLQKMQKYTGWTYEYVEMDFADAIEALKNGSIDLLPGNQYTEERAQLYDYSRLDMGEGGSVLCIRSNDERYCYNDYSLYGGMEIAALKGSIRMEQTRKKLAQYGVEVQFKEYDTDEECKNALQEQKVDAVLMSSIRCESQFKILARMDSAPLYFCTSKKRPELKIELDEAMEQNHLDNPYYEEDLNQKYYGSVQTQLAFSQEEKNYIESALPLTVAVSEDLKPLEYQDDTGEFQGSVPDMLRLIGEYSGLSFRFVPRKDKDTLIHQMEEGQVQIIATVANQPGRTDYWQAEVTDSYLDNSIAFVIKDGNRTYNKGCTVAVRTGFPYLEEIARQEGYTDFMDTDSFQECLAAVENGKAGLAVFPSNCADVLIRANSYEDLSSFLVSGSDMEFGFGVSQNVDPILISILNKSIAAIGTAKRTELLVDNLNAVNKTISLSSFVREHRAILFGSIIAVLAIIIAGLLFFLVDRQSKNKRLETALQEADAASCAKTEFLSRVSHDIRTPMNAIIGMTHLAEEETEPEEIKEYLKNIASSSDFLLGLINDILDLSKIESGELELKPEPYTMTEFKQAVNTVIKPLMDAKKIEFIFKLNCGAECILVDPLRYNQIFFNLLSNAAKFTPKGGKVEFISERMFKENGIYGVRYYIRDNGIGMSETYLPHIFDSFSQERVRENEKEIGTGLGLPIVKSLVESMNGSIEVKSKKGKGTEFILELSTPLAEKEIDSEKQAEVSIRFDQVKILLVEDNELNIIVAQKMLEKKGCHVTVAGNGQEAIDLFTQSKPGHYQIILMDIRMPVMDGITAAKKIRETGRADSKTVPIIAMTADAFAEEQKKTLEAGMNAHLAKPVNPKQLYSMIASVLDGSGK